MAKKSGVCKNPDCNRTQLKDGMGYCHICYQRFLEKKNLEQNDAIIDMLKTLNANISTLQKKVDTFNSNIKDHNPSEKIIIQKVEEKLESTKDIIKKKEKKKSEDSEYFIPEINVNTDIKTNEVKEQTQTRNIRDLANRLNTFDASNDMDNKDE